MNLVKNSFNAVISKPLASAYSFAMLIVQIMFASIFLKVNDLIFSSSQTVHTIWFIIYLLSLLFVISIFVVLMLSVLFSKKYSFKQNLNLSFRNLVIILVMVILYNLIFFASNWIAFQIGKSFLMSTNNAKILFSSLFFIGIMIFLLFVSLSSFFLVRDNFSIIRSLKASFKFMKKNYIKVLAIFVVFYFLLRLSALVTYEFSLFSLTELINYLIIYPSFASFLANIINEN